MQLIKPIWKYPIQFICAWILLCIAYTSLSFINLHIILSHYSIILLTLGVILMVILIIPTLIWMLKAQKTYATIKFTLKHRLSLIVIGIILMFICNIEIVPAHQTNQFTNQQIINAVIHSGRTGFIFMIIAVLIGPIMEEFLCRFMLIGPNPIDKHYVHKGNYFIRIAFSTVLFALLHLTPNVITGHVSGISQMLLGVTPQLEAGIVLAYLYVHTQDIRVPIFTHVIYDLISVIAIFTL